MYKCALTITIAGTRKIVAKTSPHHAAKQASLWQTSEWENSRNACRAFCKSQIGVARRMTWQACLLRPYHWAACHETQKCPLLRVTQELHAAWLGCV